MATVAPIQFWLSCDAPATGEGAKDMSDLIERWDGPEKPRYGSRAAYDMPEQRGWRRGPASDPDYPADDAYRCEACERFGMTVLPQPGQAIPYRLIAGRPINAK